MRQKNNSLWIVVPLSALLAVSGGCKKEEIPSSPPPAPHAPASPAKQPVQKQVSSVKPLAAASSHPDFSNRKDPFKPFIEAKSEKAPSLKSTPVGGLLPIQSYPAEQFRVSGIIVGLKESKALVIDPAGKGYVVKEGMNIGSSNGVITKITPAFIEVSERFRADNGRMTKRTVKLSLSRKQ